MIDDSPTERELRTAVHELVDQFIGAAEDVHGHIPGVGTPAWWIAPTSARLAGLLVLAEAYVLRSPDQIASDILKAASVAISTGCDWSAAARRPSYVELQRRRGEAA